MSEQYVTLGPWIQGMTMQYIAERVGLPLAQFLHLNPQFLMRPPYVGERVKCKAEPPAGGRGQA